MILIFTLFGAICIHSAATAAFLQDPMFSARHLERRILVDEPIARTRKLASTDFLSAATTTRRDWIEQAASTFVGLATSIAVESSTPSSTTLCDPAVSSWVNQRQGRVIHVVGTAHISSVSADLAANVVKEIKPDCLFIELDLKRIAAAFRGGRPIAGLKIALWDSEGNPRIGVTAPRPEPNPIIKWLLARETSQMFAGQGFLAGEEFITSVEEAAKLDAVVVLGDRDFGKSMGRLAEASSKTDIHKFLEADKAMAQLLKKEIPDIERWEVGSKTPSKEEIKDLIEGMKTKEKVDKLMQIFREYAPEVYVALVKERDEYMSKGLDALLIPQTTVAVVGMAHVTGVTKNLEAMGWQHVPHLC